MVECLADNVGSVVVKDGPGLFDKRQDRRRLASSMTYARRAILCTLQSDAALSERQGNFGQMQRGEYRAGAELE
jgi:hypothetical protein